MRCSNEWYNRPDLKPFAAMVDQPSDLTTRTMLEAQYNSKQGTPAKQSALYRYFLARNADFTIKENPYENAHRDDVWD